MKPIYFNLYNELPLIILPENAERDGGQISTFQLYYSSQGDQEKSLSDLNNYSGLISFNWTSQEFFYTPGNRAISSEEILQIIECIKTKYINL